MARNDPWKLFSHWASLSQPLPLCASIYIAKAKCRKFETNIPRKGISGPQSQFPHSCVCERIIYSHDGPALLEEIQYVDRSWEYINRAQTHECGNWGWGRLFPEKEYINWIAVAMYPLSPFVFFMELLDFPVLWGGLCVSRGGTISADKTTHWIPFTIWPSGEKYGNSAVTYCLLCRAVLLSDCPISLLSTDIDT